MSTSDVMTWSPGRRSVPRYGRSIQWIPSEEYHNAADSPFPLIDEPAANTPSGVDRMSLTTAPGSWLTTLSAPFSSCHCWPSVEYHTVALPSTVPAANKPERSGRHGVHHGTALVGAAPGTGHRRPGCPAREERLARGATPRRRPSWWRLSQPSRPRPDGFPSRWLRRRSRSPLRSGVGRAVLAHLVALGDVHTVATARPPVLNWVPAISQSPLAPGATTADKGAGSRPRQGRSARPRSLCQL